MKPPPRRRSSAFAGAPTRAVVLAAGHGTRMQPLSASIPKALMPLWGVPMLTHTLRLLQRWGVRDVLINCHAQADQLFDAARSLLTAGPRIHLSYEPILLGTGGVLHQAGWFLDDRPFWMINADVAADLDPAALLRHPPTGRTLATLWMEPRRGPRTVSLRRGYVDSFSEGKAGPGRAVTFCGLHLISPRILRYIPEGTSSIITAYEAAMKEGCRVAGTVVEDAYWADIGTPEQYLAAHGEVRENHRRGERGALLYDSECGATARRLKRQGVKINGFAAVDPSATIRPGAQLHNVVVLTGAVIGPRAVCRDAVVGRDAVVPHGGTRILVEATQALDPVEGKALDRLGGFQKKSQAECLGPRGSDRQFIRLSRPGQSAIFVRYDPVRAENALYADHAGLLEKAGVRVPEIYCHDRRHAWILMEDVGRVALEDVMSTATRKEAANWYENVVDLVFHFHREGTRRARRSIRPIMPPFNAALYRWERGYFYAHFVAGIGGISARLRREALRDLERVSRRLGRAKHVLIHRDLQSSNLFIHGGEIVMIDFQGMRFGPAAYDMASLICDPYVTIPEHLQQRLIARYADHDANAGADMELFGFAAVQRLAQALGAFSRLGGLPCGERFSRAVWPAVQAMHHAVRRFALPCPALLDLLDRFIEEKPLSKRDAR